jgi:putative membrane protein
MKRTLTYVAILLLTLSLANCGPGLAPGPPPGFGPGSEWIVLLFVAVAVGVWLTRSNWRNVFRAHHTRMSQAHEILRERYAKGEISREEYVRMASDLNSPGM